MAIEYNFTLDMDRSKRDNNIAYARTGDVDSITINADLVFNGAAYTPTGTNAFFECVTPNGHSVRAAAEKTGSSVSVEVPSAAFQAAGVINVAYFRFESGSSDNPTYVESTEPFAIVVREGIGDNIDAADYIEEWRQLADHLEAVVAEVEQKAEQAETAINEQKTEVDQLKAQAQKAIAGDVTEVDEAAQSAIAAINKEKADVADAAEDVSAAGEQAINTFKTNSQQAIDQFNTDGTAAINQFNTNAGSKLDEVDGMITEAQGDVDAAITQLEDKTQDAIEAAQDALDGTIATNLQNAINRTLKLDVADMTNIPDNSSLSSFTNVGSYCCKTAATAATIGDCPIDDSPFNMYVFSSGTSGQVMQLVVPIDLNSKPTAEWHVRFGTSSAMDKWSVIGGGADIAAGLGIDVTGDAKKTVSIDTTAFYQHHEAAGIIQGSTEVTGGGRFKELVVYGNTRQNLWVNPETRTSNGVTLTTNDDGSVTLSGTATANTWIITVYQYSIKPSTTYTLSVDGVVSGGTAKAGFYVSEFASDGTETPHLIKNENTSLAFTTKADCVRATYGFLAYSGATVSGTYRVMLNEGSEAQPWCPHGLNGVDELSIVTAGKNLIRISELDNVTWANNINENVEILNLLQVGVYTISASFRLNSSSNDSSSYGIVLKVGNKTIAGTNLVKWNTDEPGTVAYYSFSFNVTEENRGAFSSFFVYGAGVNGVGATGSADVFNMQLERGTQATAYEPPNITTTHVDLDGHALNSLPDGTRDELRIDGTGAVTLVQKVGSYVADGNEGWKLSASDDAPYRMSVVRWKNDVLNKILNDNNFLSTVLPASKLSDCSNGSYVVINGTYQLYAGRTGITTADAFSEWLKTSPMTVLYPLATSKIIELPSVSMPMLASPEYIVFTSSSVPAEIEADVVKVDYLPTSDVYTKEEVDQKIENAGGMPDVVPVSRGGTGVTTAAAERNRLGLGNTTGALPIANGGTGAVNAKAAQYNLLNDMAEFASNATDTSKFIMEAGSSSAAVGAVAKCSASYVWNWIVSKIRSTFGFNSSNVLTVAKGGTGGTTAKAAQNSLLNDMNLSSDALTDSSMLVGYNASPSASNGAVYKRSVTTIWDYVASKVADKVWDKIKTKAISSDTTTGTDLTMTGGLESSSQTRTSTLTLGAEEMSLENSNSAPLTVNGDEVVTEGNISSHLPAMFDAKSVWFSTPLTQGQQKNIITEGGFTLEELRKYFVPGNLVLANFVCGGDHGVQLDQVVPMVITIGEGMVMQPSGITYNSITDAHYDCIFAVANNEQAGGGGGSGLADGVTMLYSVTEVPGLADRTSTSSLKGFTVFDLVGHAI